VFTVAALKLMVDELHRQQPDAVVRFNWPGQERAVEAVMLAELQPSDPNFCDLVLLPPR
jgi:hypothetical protein